MADQSSNNVDYAEYQEPSLRMSLIRQYRSKSVPILETFMNDRRKSLTRLPIITKDSYLRMFVERVTRKDLDKPEVISNLKLLYIRLNDNLKHDVLVNTSRPGIDLLMLLLGATGTLKDLLQNSKMYQRGVNLRRDWLTSLSDTNVLQVGLLNTALLDSELYMYLPLTKRLALLNNLVYAYHIDDAELKMILNDYNAMSQATFFLELPPETRLPINRRLVWKVVEAAIKHSITNRYIVTLMLKVGIYPKQLHLPSLKLACQSNYLSVETLNIIIKHVEEVPERKVWVAETLLKSLHPMAFYYFQSVTFTPDMIMPIMINVTSHKSKLLKVLETRIIELFTTMDPVELGKYTMILSCLAPVHPLVDKINGYLQTV